MKTGRVARVARHHSVGQHRASGGFAVTRAEAAAVIRFNLHRLEITWNIMEHCENVKFRSDFRVISIFPISFHLKCLVKFSTFQYYVTA